MKASTNAQLGVQPPGIERAAAAANKLRQAATNRATAGKVTARPPALAPNNEQRQNLEQWCAAAELIGGAQVPQAPVGNLVPQAGSLGGSSTLADDHGRLVDEYFAGADQAFIEQENEMDGQRQPSEEGTQEGDERVFGEDSDHEKPAEEIHVENEKDDEVRKDKEEQTS